jgi:hypothetical protein
MDEELNGLPAGLRARCYFLTIRGRMLPPVAWLNHLLCSMRVRLRQCSKKALVICSYVQYVLWAWCSVRLPYGC